MSDLDQAIALVQRGTLTTEQLMLLHSNGQLRPPPGVRVLVVGSIPGYSDECATFHEVLSHELVRRGCATYT